MSLNLPKIANLIMAAALVGEALKPEFSQLLNSPRAYEHKRVCLTGFAHVFGDAFVIYKDEAAAKKRDFAKGIFVQQPYDGPDYNHYDRQWIHLVGVIDMKDRGFANYPCGIIVERVEPASRRKGKTKGSNLKGVLPKPCGQN